MMKYFYFLSWLSMISTTLVMGQMHGDYHIIDDFVLDNDLYRDDEVKISYFNRTYTNYEIESLKRIYDEALELLKEKGIDDFDNEYKPYNTKSEIYCRECASYIYIPATEYNKYWQILRIVHTKMNGSHRLIWNDHLSKILESNRDNWYRVNHETDTDACDKYCKKRW